MGDTARVRYIDVKSVGTVTQALAVRILKTHVITVDFQHYYDSYLSAHMREMRDRPPSHTIHFLAFLPRILKLSVGFLSPTKLAEIKATLK
jgi:hypothetical protein